MMEKIVKTVMTVRRKRSFVSDMFTSFIITFVASAFSYEGYMPKSFMDIFGPFVAFVCVLTWISYSFIGGAFKKYNYMVFMCLFWLIPQVIIYLADSGPEFFRMSITMYLLSEFSSMLTRSSAYAFGSLFGLSVFSSVVTIILLCIFSYLAGMLLSEGKAWKKVNR